MPSYAAYEYIYSESINPKSCAILRNVNFTPYDSLRKIMQSQFDKRKSHRAFLRHVNESNAYHSSIKPMYVNAATFTPKHNINAISF